jgi:DNA-binding response OmpR family regulator
MYSKELACHCRNTLMQTFATQSFDRDAVAPLVKREILPFSDLYVDLQPPSVLIADDDPNIAPLVVAALKPYHMHTESVMGGAAALSRLRERAFNLVVLDLEMAGVHGLDVLRALREIPRYEHLPVLILTANGSNDAIARSFGYGADEFVKKPFDISELGLRAFRLIRPFRQ